VLICLDKGKSLCRDKLVRDFLCAETSEGTDLDPNMLRGQMIKIELNSM
jgi:hypothetical protein